MIRLPAIASETVTPWSLVMVVSSSTTPRYRLTAAADCITEAGPRFCVLPNTLFSSDCMAEASLGAMGWALKSPETSNTLPYLMGVSC